MRETRSFYEKRLDKSFERGVKVQTMVFAKSDPSSTSAPPAYTHFWPNRSQKEQMGFSPGHRVFFRLNT